MDAKEYSRRYHALVSSSTITRANTSWTSSTGCKAQITSCYNTGSASTCSKAQSYCNSNILSPLSGSYDVYDVRAANPDPYPPQISTYLSSATLKAKIGAESTWSETNNNVYSNFAATGDWMHNSRPDLETVVNAGVCIPLIVDARALTDIIGIGAQVRTLVFDGDADYICNYQGVELMVSETLKLAR
jgi:carboxypeptidase C (cathepsin A)